MTLRDIQVENARWAKKNFPDAVERDAFDGMVEELGELAHARLKGRQGIRGSKEKHTEEEKDAIGDLLIYTMHYCTLRGFDLQTLLEDTWNEVKQRDWATNKETGSV